MWSGPRLWVQPTLSSAYLLSDLGLGTSSHPASGPSPSQWEHNGPATWRCHDGHCATEAGV
jgi:hypothetical protein